ncbi:neuronal acetylcholine receptor subunit alpha-7-like [Haliotis asinina]|uniref:neuronal acetylcholine receptor subunit alpha-7-like n=1 Tax=Haliotis asinina TaxID=109174 RepID=UPI003531931E
MAWTLFTHVFSIGIFTILLVHIQGNRLDGQARLLQHLLNNSKPQLFPSDEILYISIFFSQSQIIEHDEQRQSITTSGWFRLEWVDEALMWNISVFDNIKNITLTSDKIWTPDVLLVNSLAERTLFNHQTVPVSVEHTGLVTWYHCDLFQSHCDFDVLHFPFDTQTCSLVLSTWATQSDSMHLTPGARKFNENLAFENGLWQLEDISTFAYDTVYPYLTVTLTIKRQPSYYVFNIIIPIVLLSILSSLVFALPAEYGDKVSLSMTVLLSFGVFLTQITNNMPKTSRQTSYLTIYLTILLTLSSIHVVMSVVILRMHRRQGVVPLVLQKLVICWKCCHSNKKLDLDVHENHIDDMNTKKCTDGPTWKDVAAMLDALCLRVFFIINITCGAIFFAILTM